mmetsp:Transcript_37336/g.57310  ORF Transcript_37336/g.57310 Transcript_37336/m.57310 type:complete len:426 (+) Transcript_37336:279-1556(+)|eukprot:CAMPEP_0118684318 /NCGR_PEP_ID=MMETSP0800-20121206/6576_1 /TAXON_ID=210618 ORGANISM="Striatella unipunctata, Strain CCMP2910" /NCGR_SAMPLE_ID=MMETSP0800 /ASSEMBLY_ACC=CAM_ASM_000638 /LENGTH=425 /DNA_ID=CAMNT_0006581009 /DNA_START=262 /DNA_END=1539 /DNA_ORIENTATION=-
MFFKRDLQVDDDATNPTFDTVAEVLSNTFLFLLIFGMSATVDTKNVLSQLQNKFAISTGVSMQFLIMPFLGYLAIQGLKSQGLSEPMGLALLIVTASPGGSYSNWWCSTFNADLALSVAMTAISTILSIALLPANLMLYAHAAYGFDRQAEDNILDSLDFGSLFIALGIVIVAILTGLFVSYKNKSIVFRQRANRLGSISGILLIMSGALISQSGGGGSEEEDANVVDKPWSFYVGVAFPCLAGLFVANLLSRIARLSKPEVVTLSVECCYQNVGIATAAAVNMFDDPTERAEALFVPLFYGFIEAVVLGLYCILAWKLGWTKAPADASFWTIVSTTYEVSSTDAKTHTDDEERTNQDETQDEESQMAHFYDEDPKKARQTKSPEGQSLKIIDQQSQNKSKSIARGTLTEPDAKSGFAELAKLDK